MATNGKADMDKIEEKSTIYIGAWLARQEERRKRIKLFGDLKPGDKFVLPGGKSVQVKKNFYLAQTAMGPMAYGESEEVVPV